MKVLIFGWELPPENSGGLGVACFNLTKALSEKAERVVFVLPKKTGVCKDNFDIIFANVKVEVKKVKSLLSAYLTQDRYFKLLSNIEESDFYGNTLFEEVARYGKEARLIAEREDFDVIHAHDWLSFLAGIEAKKVSKKPLIVHVHATEFDRSGGSNVNPLVYKIEKQGMEQADKIIAVSELTKNTLIDNYGILPEKIEVVYNAHEDKIITKYEDVKDSLDKRPIVAFLGRITIQKGPDYFLAAAKKCLDYDPNILFVMAGSGDMQTQIIQEASELGIADKFLFAGFLRGEEKDKLYQSADLYVLPSISEPFGITVLESIQNGTPVLLSRQAGVGESLTHCLKADFWDIDDMANKILSVVKHKELKDCLSENGQRDLRKFSWKKSAQKCVDIYSKVLKK